MKWRIDSRCWLVLGAVVLWGCPIDDATFKEPGASSSGSSSSGSEASSSGASSGGAGGSGGGTAGTGGVGGGAGGAPTLVMVGTGTNGVMGTFVASDSPPWKIMPYMNEPSTHAPALVVMPGKDQAMALIRRTDTMIRYVTWTPAGFSGWSSMGGSAASNAAVSAAATNTAIHVAFYGTDSKHFYAQSTDATTFMIADEAVNPIPGMPTNQAFGAFPASIAALSAGPLVAYAGQDKDLYTHERDGVGAWPALDHNTGLTLGEVPAIVTYDGNPARDVLIVVMQSLGINNQLYWTARENGMWTTPALITNAKSTEPVLLALPNGDAILTYRDATKKVWWTRFTGIDAKWSPPLQPPGNQAAKLKPALALGAGGAEVELLFVDDATSAGYHARLVKGAVNFTVPVEIPGATGLDGIAAATNF